MTFIMVTCLVKIHAIHVRCRENWLQSLSTWSDSFFVDSVRLSVRTFLFCCFDKFSFLGNRKTGPIHEFSNSLVTVLVISLSFLSCSSFGGVGLVSSHLDSHQQRLYSLCLLTLQISLVSFSWICCFFSEVRKEIQWAV